MPRSLVVACLAAVAYAAAPSVVSAHVDTVSRSQANEINVFMSCVSFVPGSDTTLLRGVFGYENATSSTITEPVGVGNFTSPGNINRGQPETFLPGFHPFAFATSFVLNGGATQITWFLRGNTAQIIHPDGYPNHTIPPCGTFSAGDWRPGTTYRLFDVVRHDGASWIAMDNVDTSEPGTDPGWQPFADAGPQGPVGPSGPQGLDGPSGAVGPAGPTGTSGAAGTPGSQGAAGTSGPPAGAIQPPAAFFPSPITWSFSSKGRWRIVDPHVTPASVITIQYVGRGGGKPTSISEQTAGSFIASGTPRGRFRYVVYNPPSS